MTPREACPLCDDARRVRLFQKGGYPLVRCASCGLVYTDVDLDTKDLLALYSDTYYGGEVFDDYLSDYAERLDGARHLTTVLARIEPSGRLLDVGCAFGIFLEAASEVYDPTGVEISDYAADYARRTFGHRVLTGDVADLDFGGEQFDIVTLWNTVEHLFDPMRTLQAVAQLMGPGSLLVLTTGDVTGPLARRNLRGWNLMDPPEHLSFFSPQTIARLLVSTGFELRRIAFDGIVRGQGPLASRPARLLASAAGFGNVMTAYARRTSGDRDGTAAGGRAPLSRFRPLSAV